MRIGQKTLSKKNTKTVTFYRGDEPITITVGPMPPKYLERLRAQVLVRPEPPKKAVETKPGIFLREGNKVVFQEDENDPKYTEDFGKYYSRIITAKLLAYLAYDPEVQLTVVKPEASYADAPEAWRDYFDAASGEITHPETGFTSAEIDYIMKAGDSTELCVDIEDATKTF